METKKEKNEIVKKLRKEIRIAEIINRVRDSEKSNKKKE